MVGTSQSISTLGDVQHKIAARNLRILRYPSQTPGAQCTRPADGVKRSQESCGWVLLPLRANLGFAEVLSCRRARRLSTELFFAKFWRAGAFKGEPILAK